MSFLRGCRFIEPIIFTLSDILFSLSLYFVGQFTKLLLGFAFIARIFCVPALIFYVSDIFLIYCFILALCGFILCRTCIGGEFHQEV